MELKTEETVTVDLKGVPETMLWPLWNRAGEQRVKNPLLQDPMAVELVENIDYDFEASFGKPNVAHAVRSRVIDDAIKAWMADHPQGTVVSLGEGLDSQFWRVDNGTITWVSVDLPESVAFREKFLPPHERIKHVACSALDPAWMEAVPPGDPVFIVMAGLLMYFKETEVNDLLFQIAEIFPGSELFFDIISCWWSGKSLKGWQVTKTYQAPPMPWGLDYGDCDKILAIHPALRVKQRMTYADPYPKRMRPYNYLSKIKWIRNKMAPWMLHLEVDAGGDS